MSWDYQQSWRGYAKLWDAAKIVPAHHDALLHIGRIFLQTRAVYDRLEKATGVPAWLIFALHWRESNADMRTYLGNGQSLSHRTTIVPIGRGPFTGPDAFYEGALDALHLEAKGKLIAAGEDGWTLEEALFWAEKYNGQGYPVNTPYLWNYTTQYNGGLYIRDHVFDINAHDKNAGVAAIFLVLQELGVKLAPREGAKGTTMPTTQPTTNPVISVNGIDFDKLGALLNMVAATANNFSWLLPPPVKKLLVLIPIAQDFIQGVSEVRKANGDLTLIAGIVQLHLHRLADKIKEMVPQPPADLKLVEGKVVFSPLPQPQPTDTKPVV